MAYSAVSLGTGATFTFSGFTYQLNSIQWSGISRQAIKTSHLGTTVATASNFGSDSFLPSKLSDPGTLEFEFNMDPDQNPPIDGVAAAFTLTFINTPSDSAAWTGTAFMTDFSFSIPLEDKLVGNATFKVTGLVTTGVDS